MISDIVWRYEVDGQGQFVNSYISPAADRLLGLPAGTIGNDFNKHFSYIFPEDLPAVQETLSLGLSTLAKDATSEYRMRRPDGTTLWVRAKGSAYLQPDGHVVGFGVTSDITERKHVEEALRQSEERYRGLIDICPDSVLVSDLTGRTLFVSKQTWKLLNVSEQVELVGKRLVRLHHRSRPASLGGEPRRVDPNRKARTHRVYRSSPGWDDGSRRVVLRRDSERRKATDCDHGDDSRYIGTPAGRRVAEGERIEIPKPLSRLADFASGGGLQRGPDASRSASRRRGRGFSRYFENHPEAVRECARRSRFST